MIDDACCAFETVQNVNKKLAPVLDQLVSTSFFRYWKTTLHKDCPFWQENPLCILRDCSVIEAEEHEIPEHWKSASLSSVDEDASALGGSASPFSFLSLKTKCGYKDVDFCVVEDEASNEGCYVDLIKNPERFTGYAGESPARIWGAIYKENCFGYENTLASSLGVHGLATDNTCMEKRVFYKLISGLHSSISTHICDQYLDRTTGNWIRNLTCFAERVGDHPDRIHNLYFTYTILLRAVSKLAPYLQDHEAHQFCAGNGADTQEIEDLVSKVSQLTTQCGPTFDEKLLFNGPGSTYLKQEFKTHFRNISEIMDCVGCEKCKLWGKLQVSGLGTALKILFSYDDSKPELYRLTRGEIVSLFNTVHRLSESVEAIDRFRDLHRKQGLDQVIADELIEESKKMSAFGKPIQSVGGDGAAVPVVPPFGSLSLGTLMSYSEVNDPRHYISYFVGFFIVVYGTVKIAQRAWQLHKGTLKLPDGWEERNKEAAAKAKKEGDWEEVEEVPGTVVDPNLVVKAKEGEIHRRIPRSTPSPTAS
ncbi:hypothetical protein HKX48_005045 [Thoreauomyces humboldtii]|nr:hypothetical protein HKX48_005045 [Thoreauomyces humboldtii]